MGHGVEEENSPSLQSSGSEEKRKVTVPGAGRTVPRWQELGSYTRCPLHGTSAVALGWSCDFFWYHSQTKVSQKKKKNYCACVL